MIDKWLAEAKNHENADKIGMYLTHNGVVRATSRAEVRDGMNGTGAVTAMEFGYDEKKVEEVVAAAYKLPGIYYIRTWLAEGRLEVGDDIMYVLIGGDIRPHVMEALDYLVGRLKSECVSETEIYD